MKTVAQDTVVGLTASNICGQSSDTFSAVFFPPIEVELGPDQTLCAGESVILDATWKGASYLWNTGSQDSAIFVNEPNNYVVTITEGDCNKVEQVNIVFETDPCDSLSLCKFEIPNVFTPNSDGLNDVLRIENLCEDFAFQVLIYNRWGSLVYSVMARQRMIWDGFINGKPASDGTYFVQITYNLGGVAKNAKGSFQLLR